jgi:tetratricopeptide (TPR) repeat protein
LRPELAAAYISRGRARLARNDPDAAIADFTQALVVDPNNLRAYHERGLARALRRDFDQAVVDHLEAIRRAPKAAEAFDNFARYWLTCPEQRNGQMALELATRACELSHWQDWKCLGTLAAAYAELRERDDAVRWAQRSLELASDKDKRLQQRLLAECKSRL